MAFYRGMLQKEQQRAAPLGASSTQEKPRSPFSSPHSTTNAQLSFPSSKGWIILGREEENAAVMSCSQQSPARLDTTGVRQAPHTTQRFGCSQRAQLASYINDLRAEPPRPPAQAADAPRPNPPSPGQTSPNQHLGFFPRRSWGTL